MKLSELKSEIKEYIYEILSEKNDNITESGEKTAVITFRGGKTSPVEYKNDNELKKIADNNDVQSIVTSDDKKLKEADPAAIKAIDAKIQNDPEFLKKTKDAMAKAEKGDTTDLATLMGGFGKMFESDDEDKEPTKAELEKEKVKGAPSKFKIPQTDFEDFKSKLKTLVKKIKDMEKGDERTKKMAALKQFIKKPELVKAFKERDVQIDTGDLVG